MAVGKGGRCPCHECVNLPPQYILETVCSRRCSLKDTSGHRIATCSSFSSGLTLPLISCTVQAFSQGTTSRTVERINDNVLFKWRWTSRCDRRPHIQEQNYRVCLNKLHDIIKGTIWRNSSSRFASNSGESSSMSNRRL